MNSIARWWGHVQGLLFRGVEAGLEERVTEKHRQVMKVLEVVRVEEHVQEVWRWCGRPRASRRAMARVPPWRDGEGGVQRSDDGGVPGAVADRPEPVSDMWVGSSGGGAERVDLLAGV